MQHCTLAVYDEETYEYYSRIIEQTGSIFTFFIFPVIIK